MTDKQRRYKNALLRKIHVSDIYVKFYKDDRDAWEEFLEKNFGVRSSKYLSIDELKKLNDFLNGKLNRLNRASDNQINYILALWKKRSMYKEITSLLKFIKRTIKRDLTTLEELTKKEATNVIVAIKKLKPLKPANNKIISKNGIS